MGWIGQLERFEVGGDFQTYIERLEQLFIANDVQEDKKVALLITFIGAEVYQILKNLISPAKPSEKKYEELKQVMLSHFTPEKLIIAERYKFYKCVQKETQNIQSFFMEIKKLAVTCNFGIFLQEALRDKFICGLKNENIQRRLLTENNISLEEAYKKALGLESAEIEQKEVREASSSTQGIYYNKNERKTWKKSCWRCGRLHAADTCFAKDLNCFKCNRKGHLSFKCVKAMSIEEEEEEINTGIANEEDKKPMSLGHISGDEPYIINL